MKNLVGYKLVLPFLIILGVSCKNSGKDNHAKHTVQESRDVYTCPMHPEIIRNEPGSCPICGMDLVKKETGNKSIQDLELDALLRPSNEFVVSSVPVTTMEQREEDIELSVVGTVAYDNRKAGAISSRVKGRIERLYIRYRYQPVKKGQRVMDIYSPDLLTAQQNLIFLLRNDPENSSLIEAAKDRLILIGMSANSVAQVLKTKTPQYSVPVYSNYEGIVTDIIRTSNSLETGNMEPRSERSEELSVKEGMYVERGQTIFSVYDASRAWILLDIFPEQQALIKIGNFVRIIPETSPEQDFRAKIDYIEPVFREGTKTLSARIYFNNAKMRLPIGSRVTANVFISPKDANWLPKEAVLTLGREKIVFLKQDGGFRARKILTGLRKNGSIQVIGGLSATDSVASNAQFLIDNEAFLKVGKQ